MAWPPALPLQPLWVLCVMAPVQLSSRGALLPHSCTTSPLVHGNQWVSTVPLKESFLNTLALFSGWAYCHVDFLFFELSWHTWLFLISISFSNTNCNKCPNSPEALPFSLNVLYLSTSTFWEVKGTCLCFWYNFKAENSSSWEVKKPTDSSSIKLCDF